jgi:hypothetical protein
VPIGASVTQPLGAGRYEGRSLKWPRALAEPKVIGKPSQVQYNEEVTVEVAALTFWNPALIGDT